MWELDCIVCGGQDCVIALSPGGGRRSVAFELGLQAWLGLEDTIILFGEKPRAEAG